MLIISKCIKIRHNNANKVINYQNYAAIYNKKAYNIFLIQ